MHGVQLAIFSFDGLTCIGLPLKSDKPLEVNTSTTNWRLTCEHVLFDQRSKQHTKIFLLDLSASKTVSRLQLIDFATVEVRLTLDSLESEMEGRKSVSRFSCLVQISL